MNDRTRRYLSEDWDETAVEPGEAKREDKPAKKPLAQDRRQREKEWGRAIAKMHKQKRKHGAGKP